MTLSLYKILIEQSKYSLDGTTNKTGDDKAEKFRQSMLKTVGVSNIGTNKQFEEAEKTQNTTMWLNLWARDTIKDFTKNNIDKVVPTGSGGYCKPGFINAYKYDSDRVFNGDNSLLKRIENQTTNKFYICSPLMGLDFNKSWDYEFPGPYGEKINWYQLMQLDWGTTNLKVLEDKWRSLLGNMNNPENDAMWCNFDDSGKEICNKSIYVNSIFEWFKDPHNVLTFFEIVTVFIPVVGPFISTALGVSNAALYFKEGENQDAVLSLFFSALPLAGPVGGKIVANLGKEGAETLSQKIIKQNLRKEVEMGISNPKNFEKTLNKIKNNFTEQELNTLKQISSNKKTIDKELKNLGSTPEGQKKLKNLVINNKNKIEKYITKYKEVSKKTSSEIKGLSNKKNVTDTGIQGGGFVGGMGIDYGLNKLKIKNTVTDEGYDWEVVKKEFSSLKGSAEDNLLLKKAWEKGWRPGKDIPEEYQTVTKKESLNNTKSLVDLLDSFDNEK